MTNPVPDRFVYRPDLSTAATAKLLLQQPVHNWFYFPHSFSPELVDAIWDKWIQQSIASVIDPFVGAGTTLLRARERGLSSLGCDMSPLAVLISRVKTTPVSSGWVRQALRLVLEEAVKDRELPLAISPRLQRAFTQVEYVTLWKLRKAIQQTDGPVREFLLLALIGIARKLSRAVPDGGWFRWVEKPDQSHQVVPSFYAHAERMIVELEQCNQSQRVSTTTVLQGDARTLDPSPDRFDSLITSPPYPNRHDYSRIFQIELLLLGCGEEEITRFRHGSLRSHVEAKPLRDPLSSDYVVPDLLRRTFELLPLSTDHRIPRMLNGYFEDMYLTLSSAKHYIRSGGKLAFVVGNTRHAGVMIPVDEILAVIGEMAGLEWDETWIIRLRGNSAQQMGRYGRIPSRESIVFFNRP